MFVSFPPAVCECVLLLEQWWRGHEVGQAGRALITEGPTGQFRVLNVRALTYRLTYFAELFL